MSFVGVTSTSSHRDLHIDRDRVWVNGFAAAVPLADLEGPERRPDRGANRIGRFSDIGTDCVWSAVSQPGRSYRSSSSVRPSGILARVGRTSIFLLSSTAPPLLSSPPVPPLHFSLSLSLSRRGFFPFLPRPVHRRLLLERRCSVSW